MNLVLSLTERCNLRCTYCYYKVSHEARSLVMSNDIMEAAIKIARTAPCLTIPSSSL